MEKSLVCFRFMKVTFYQDKRNIVDGIQHAADMLKEMRTPFLSPKSYYELFVLAIIVQSISDYLAVVILLKCSGCPTHREIMRDLVEMCRGVQHPIRGLFLRSYLLHALRSDLLPDCEDQLPYAVDLQGNCDGTSPESQQKFDAGTREIDGAVMVSQTSTAANTEGTITDSVTFLLLNFAEMNKLWVRMQHQGHSRDREQREQERRELRLLVGTNLNRTPFRCVFSRYCFTSRSQVFPDEFHLATLPLLLRTCSHLQCGVKLRQIVCSLIERELNSDPANMKSRHAVLSSVVANGLPPEDIPGIYTALVYLAMLLYPDSSPALVDACLIANCRFFEPVLGSLKVSPASPLSRELLRLLHLPLGGSTPHVGTNMTHIGVGSVPNAPLGALGELRIVLSMPGFRRLVSLLDQKTTQWRLACNLLSGALEREQRQHQVRKGLTHEATGATLSSRLTTEADLDGLFDLIDGLLITDATSAEDPEEFVEAQSLVAGVLHLIGPEPRTDPSLCLTLFTRAQLRLAQAGPAIIRFNFPSLVFEGLQLLCEFMTIDRNRPNWDADVCKTVEFIHRCVTMLVASEAPEIALRLFLKSALAIDQVEFSKRESMAYEFVSQALTLYEEGVSEARAQIDAIALITSTLCQMRCFDEEDRRTLHTQCTRAAAHLLRKHDQSRAVAATAHLHWPVPALDRTGTTPSVLISVTDKSEQQFTIPSRSEDISAERLNALRDGKAAVACLDRAARLACDFMDKTVRAQLFIEVLNHAINLRSADCHEVTDERLNDWITLIRNLIKELPPSATTDQIVAHFHNTLSYMNEFCSEKKTEANGSTGEDAVTKLFSSVNLEG
ncbi:Vacuolar protein sorting-associated protein 35 [Fasciola gigantica]|uniref:Vacuolar protein sorting-associated protein 35 n=1 Tax=Fasciola gigantica TaxID=46835 RepID=A0A504YNL0_FASGI|nr:Vacuolar protein sorting-associated protein 35 [Fasciola gigantica]